MDLKFRRNLPLLLLFVTTVSVLVLGLGRQPIIAYTFEAENGIESPTVTEGDLVDDVNELSVQTTTQDVDIIAPSSDTAVEFEKTSLGDTDTYPAQDLENTVDSGGVGLSTFQPDEG